MVFLSYSHDDAQWAQRIGVLLKPLLRRERLRLWVDTDLRAGDAWQSEIRRGIHVLGSSLGARLALEIDIHQLRHAHATELVELRALLRRLHRTRCTACVGGEHPNLADFTDQTAAPAGLGVGDLCDRLWRVGGGRRLLR